MQLIYLYVMAVNAFFLSQPKSPHMVMVAGGEFVMGQLDGEGDERPVHKVKLDDFYSGKYEVTVEEYRIFCTAKSKEMPDPPEWGWIDNHPIFNISWNDASEYIDWLNRQLNQNYRLPTEAEFEFVIRAGVNAGVYPWGDDLPNENVADERLLTSGWQRGYWKGYNDGYAYSSPVGSFPANELGVHDINGNVWEWVSDWYADYKEYEVINPKGPKTGSHKVGRGASYNADPWHCRSAGRNWMEPHIPVSAGFRLARDN